MIAKCQKIIKNHPMLKKSDQCLSIIKKLKGLKYAGTISENAESHKNSFISNSAQCKNMECSSTLVIMHSQIEQSFHHVIAPLDD